MPRVDSRLTDQFGRDYAAAVKLRLNLKFAALRRVLFWLHLAAGVSAGLVILVMSATGAVLAFKPQILNRVEYDVRFVTPEDGERLPASRLIAAARVLRPDATPASLALDRDPSAAAAVSLGRDATVYVNPYSGNVLGEGSTQAQQFFRSVENWHRWLAVDDDNLGPRVR